MNIYNIADKTEYQANLFAADLLLDDDEVDELAMQEGIDFYTMARYLYTNPQLLGFKLFSMANRGYKYNFRNYSEPPSNSQKPILLHKLTNNILHSISFDCWIVANL